MYCKEEKRFVLPPFEEIENDSLNEEITESHNSDKSIFEVTKFVRTVQDDIENLSNYYLRIRGSSLRTLKPNLKARGSIIAGLQTRLEEIRFMYRVSLTKRFQIYRRSKTSSSLEDIHVNSSPLEYQMLHLNPRRLLIHPEHFPRTQNSSGLSSLVTSQRKTSYPPSNAQKHHWIDYKVVRSVSSSISPERRHSPPKPSRSQDPPTNTSLKRLWEGTEYKLQLLASLYEKLMLKLIFELWRYPLYVKRLLLISEKNIHRLQERTLKQLVLNCLKYYYFGAKLLELQSFKTVQQYLFRKKVIPHFFIWRDRQITKKARRQYFKTSRLSTHHLRFKQRQLFHYWRKEWLRLQRRKLLHRFASDYSSLRPLLSSWKHWQAVFLSKHSLRVEMTRLYHSKRRSQAMEERGVSSAVFQLESRHFLLRYYQQDLIRQYTSKQHELVQRWKRRFPSTVQENKTKEEEEAPVAIMGNYLKQHSRAKKFKELLTQTGNLIRQAVDSKRVLPQQRFDQGSEDSVTSDSPLFSQDLLQLDPSDKKKTELYDRSDISFASEPAVWSPSFLGEHSRIHRLTSVEREELNFSQRFTDQLLHLSFEIQERERKEQESLLDLEELAPQKRMKLWKYLQMKQIDRFVSRAFQFFRSLKDSCRLRQQFLRIQLHFYQRPLQRRFLQHWREHYQRRQDYQLILADQYYQRLRTKIWILWRQYLQEKFAYILPRVSDWKKQRLLQQHWRQWQDFYQQRCQQQWYCQQYQQIHKKYLFKHWKFYTHQIHQLRQKILAVYRCLFYRKYFQFWQEKYRKKSLLKRVFALYAHNVHTQYYEQHSFAYQVKSNFQLLDSIFQSWKDYSARRRQQRKDSEQMMLSLYFRGLQLYSRHFLAWKVFCYQGKRIQLFQQRVQQRQMQVIFQQWRSLSKYTNLEEEQQRVMLLYLVYLRRLLGKWRRLCYHRWQDRQEKGQEIYQADERRRLRSSWRQWRSLFCLLQLQKKSAQAEKKREVFYLHRCWGLWKKLLWKRRRYRRGCELLSRIYYRAKLRKALFQFPSKQLQLRLQAFREKRELRRAKPPKVGFLQGVQLVDEKEEQKTTSTRTSESFPSDDGLLLQSMRRSDYEQEEVEQEVEDSDVSGDVPVEEEKRTADSRARRAENRFSNNNYSEEADLLPQRGSSNPSNTTNTTTITSSSEQTKSFIKEKKLILSLPDRAFAYGFISSPNDFLALREILLLLKTILSVWANYKERRKQLESRCRYWFYIRRRLVLEQSWRKWMRLTPRLAHRFVTWMRQKRDLFTVK